RKRQTDREPLDLRQPVLRRETLPDRPLEWRNERVEERPVDGDADAAGDDLAGRAEGPGQEAGGDFPRPSATVFAARGHRVEPGRKPRGVEPERAAPAGARLSVDGEPQILLAGARP